MARRTLTIALERYDRHIPFFLGTVTPPDGVELRALEVGMVPPRRDGVARHGRMLRDREFDICEVSLASYIMARSRGADFTATPVFPRRLFSQNHIFVSARSGIAGPRDLIGRKVALWAWQVTMSVLAKGDLASLYGVPWREVEWYTMHGEELPWRPGPGVSIRAVPAGRDVGEMLLDGEIDALINPHPPHSVLDAGGRIRRLFPDARAECRRHFETVGYYPIMHLLAFPAELVDGATWLPRATMAMWEEAKAQAADFYHDPGYATLAFARNEFEAQRDELGPDPWPSGLAANRANLERFIGYCYEQGLIEAPMPVDSLFHDSVLDT